MSETFNPIKVGQVWVSKDKRDNGRRVEVLHQFYGGTHYEIASPHYPNHNRRRIKAETLRARYQLETDSPREENEHDGHR